MKTAQSSSLPQSIQREKVHLTVSGSQAKLRTGPKFPRPGPTLLMQVITPVMLETKSTPNAVEIITAKSVRSM